MLEEVNLNILVVDDSDICRKVIKESLKRVAMTMNSNLGADARIVRFNISEADDGVSALAAFTGIGNPSEAFDIIFLDNIMRSKSA